MKCAVVTGSTKGIGKAIALKLLKNEYFVILNYSKDDAGADDLDNQLVQFKGKYEIVKKELSSYQRAIEFIEEIKKIVNHVDCLVLNCGATDRSRFEEIEKENWEYVMNVNLNVPFYLIQNLNSYFKEKARIILVGSIMGIYPHASSLSYAVSKAGIHQMAKELVKVFADRGITVNAIAPGFVNTPWQEGKSEAQKKRIEEKVGMGRFGEVEEIADMCFAMIQNDYLNGSVIQIDGGYSYK